MSAASQDRLAARSTPAELLLFCARYSEDSRRLARLGEQGYDTAGGVGHCLWLLSRPQLAGRRVAHRECATGVVSTASLSALGLQPPGGVLASAGEREAGMSYMIIASQPEGPARYTGLSQREVQSKLAELHRTGFPYVVFDEDTGNIMQWVVGAQHKDGDQ